MVPAQTRVRCCSIAERAVTENGLIFNTHFPPFPNLGDIAKEGHRWRW